MFLASALWVSALEASVGTFFLAVAAVMKLCFRQSLGLSEKPRSTS